MKMERIEWSEDDDQNLNNPHIHRTAYVGSVFINDRLYLFTNIAPENVSPVKIVDFNQRRLFPI